MSEVSERYRQFDTGIPGRGFGLDEVPGRMPWRDNGGIGRGHAGTTYFFATEEGRRYFLQAREYEEAAYNSAMRAVSLENFVRSLLTTSGRLKNGSATKIAEYIKQFQS